MFDGLDTDTQAAVLTAADAAQTRGWEMSAAEAESMTAALADNGIIVYEPSETLIADLQGIGATMLENWKANASDAALAVLESYNN